jgi:hypothetical protein
MPNNALQPIAAKTRRRLSAKVRTTSMPISLPAVVAAVTSAGALVFWVRWRRAVRAEYIRAYVFPNGLFEKLRKKQPHLSLKDCQLVGHALRQFFLTYLKSGFGYVSMPSQATDDLWHELILYTKGYKSFCDRAFGRFLHHSPAIVLSSKHQANQGLRRVWWHACAEENINPRKPTRLPLLFAIDAKLDIPDGFRYSTDCSGLRKRGDAGADGGVIYCGGDFSSSDFDGTTDGFGDSLGGDASSDAGDGCGGGGCGGD